MMHHGWWGVRDQHNAERVAFAEKASARGGSSVAEIRGRRLREMLRNGLGVLGVSVKKHVEKGKRGLGEAHKIANGNLLASS